MKTIEPGSTISGFRIDGILGQGGFATVYAAVDAHGTAVALKVMTLSADPAQSAQSRSRFHREVAALERLQSPHTVRLHAHGDLGDSLYLVFERLPGRDLRAVLEAEGKLDPALVVHIIRGVLASLAEAHAAGLLHRDIKPDNIRIIDNPAGQPLVKLFDFGIARPTDDGSPAVTATGEVMGTPRYMSPEQLRGQGLTAASDVYSVGMVAFELLMGSQAMQGYKIGDQLERLRSGHLFAMPELAEANLDVMRLVQRMTNTDPAQRPPDAANALRQLVAIDAGSTRALQRPAPAPVSGDASRSTRRLMTLAALVVPIALCVVAIVFVATQQRGEPQPAAAVRHFAVAQNPSDGPAPVTDLDTSRTQDVGTSAREPDGCGRPIDKRGHVRLAGVHAYIPSSYEPDRRHPLIVLLEHSHHRPKAFLAGSGFTELAEEERFLVVGTKRAVGAWRDPSRYVDDIASDVEELRARACIDEAQVFLVSHYKGARAAMALSCEPWVAGIAVHSYLPVIDSPYWCERPVPALWMTPMNSPRIPSDGSLGCGKSTSVAVDELERMWRTRNRCAAENRLSFADAGATCNHWNCDVPFESCRLNGGYLWEDLAPGKFDALRCEPEQPADFAIAKRTWAFLQEVVQLTGSSVADR